jgi:hypothetical protein
MFGKTSLPPGEPPIYPMDSEPEQPLQEATFAPPERVLALASASGVVSLGPVAHDPLLRTQFTSLFWDLSVIWRIDFGGGGYESCCCS